MTLRVLVADDDPVSRLRLARTLAGWGYEVLDAPDGAAAWELLRDQPRSSSVLAVLDWQMPGLDGLALTARIKADLDARFTYVIVLTAKAATSDIVTAMEAGADDFVAKPFHPDELKVRVRAGVRILEMQRELLLRASHDELSGTHTRRWLMELFDRELSRARRESRPLAVAMIDIDHFKRVNDAHGHPVGDVVIREVARRLSAILRGSDLLGRYGGEEFIAVLPDCDVAHAREVADRLHAAVRDVPVVAGDLSLPVTVSIGVAAAGAADGLDRDAMVAAADRALYVAKARGRDRVALAGDEAPGQAAS